MKDLIYDIDKHITVPEEPAELTRDQLIAIAAVLHSDMEILTASIKVLHIFSGRSWFEFKRIPDDAKLAMIDHIDWVFDDWDFSEQLLPEYAGFYGPTTELDNLRLSEFYISEKLYSALVIDEDKSALDQLVAVLYRLPKDCYDIEKDIDGDIRQPFNGNTIPYYAKQIKNWPLAVKQAILLWYDGCRKKIASENEEIFNGAGDNEDNDKDMFGILRALAGGKYGDFEKVENLYLNTALREMNCSIADIKRLEAQTKK